MLLIKLQIKIDMNGIYGDIQTGITMEISQPMPEVPHKDMRIVLGKTRVDVFRVIYDADDNEYTVICSPMNIYHTEDFNTIKDAVEFFEANNWKIADEN